MIGSVQTTYRGYTIYVDDRDILAIAPNGDTYCQPSMSTIRRWIRRHERLGGREPIPTLSQGEGPPAERSLRIVS